MNNTYWAMLLFGLFGLYIVARLSIDYYHERKTKHYKSLLSEIELHDEREERNGA